MDDPTRRCENDTDNGTRLLGAPGPKREPHFFIGLDDSNGLYYRTFVTRSVSCSLPLFCVR
jgi:hypothetical protein